MPGRRARPKKSWQQLIDTLDEIAPHGQPIAPTEMIMSVVEAIYDDYAKANFANYELRKEDLTQLAAFARQFKDANEFLSQLALISNVDAEPAATQANDEEAVNLSSVHQAKGLEFHTVFVIWLTDGMFPELALARNARRDRRGTAPLLRRDHPGERRTLPHLSAYAPQRRLWRHVSTAFAFPERNPVPARRRLECAAGLSTT